MPEPDALREASYFVERLGEERMPLAGLILNRVHSPSASGRSSQLSAARSLAAAETLEAASQNGGGASAWHRPATPPTAAALRLHAERMNLGERERRVAGSFMSAHPAVPVIEVPALPEDVHDLAGLRRVGEAFAGNSWLSPGAVAGQASLPACDGRCCEAQALATSSSMPWRS